MLFRWAWNGIGGRKDNCIIADSPEGSDLLRGMENELPNLKSMIEQPTELEDFLKRVGSNYHGSGHTAVSKGGKAYYLLSNKVPDIDQLCSAHLGARAVMVFSCYTQPTHPGIQI